LVLEVSAGCASLPLAAWGVATLCCSPPAVEAEAFFFSIAGGRVLLHLLHQLQPETLDNRPKRQQQDWSLKSLQGG
jgi:hypothetical protein